MKQRKQRPLFFIDIAVPRDIDPRINHLDNVYLYDIDDLQGVVVHNIAARKNEAVQAERIVQEESVKFRNWMNGLEVVPTIIALRNKIEDIRRGELKKAGPVLQELTPEQQKGIEAMSQAMINKILHDPITFLKKPGDPFQVSKQADLTQKVFNPQRRSGSRGKFVVMADIISIDERLKEQRDKQLSEQKKGA